MSVSVDNFPGVDNWSIFHHLVYGPPHGSDGVPEASVKTTVVAILLCPLEQYAVLRDGIVYSIISRMSQLGKIQLTVGIHNSQLMEL